MKILSGILSFYLVLLLVVPCCAFDACPEDQAATSQTDTHQSGDEDDCGTCSPFFNCERCSSVTIHPEIVEASVPVNTDKSSYAELIVPMMPGAHYDFWQPPRIDG